jgi:hypothetical protein
LGWAWAGPAASVRRRVVHVVGAGLVALTTLEVISAVSGTGWGWLRTTNAADQSFTAVTPVNAIAKALSGVARLVEVNIPVLGARTVVSVIGLLCAAAIGTWLLLRSPGPTMQRNLGLTLLVVALLGPVLWNWYVTWGVIVLAPAATATLRRVVITISTFEILVGLSSVKNLVSTVVGAGILPDLILVAVIFAVVITPLGQFGRFRPSLHAARSGTDRPMIGLPV